MPKAWMKGAAVLAVALVALSACGKKGSPGENPGGTALATCDGAAVPDTGLPSDFPVPDAVTFVKVAKAGPSQVADGFATEELEGMYNEWKDILGQVHYTILFSEIEAPNDAEISFQGPTATGQIALRNQCGEGKIAVHVTSRPR